VYEINKKILILSRHFIFGGYVLDLNKIVPWQRWFFFGVSA